MATAALTTYEVPDSQAHAAAIRAGVSILDIFDASPWFRTGSDWTPWRAFLAALYGLPMTKAETAIFRRCTGRTVAPTAKHREGWLVCGRRSRKTAISSLVGVYEGAYRDHSRYLAPGERAIIPMVAKNKADAQQLHDYVLAIFRAGLTWMLKLPVTGEAKVESIALVNQCDYMIRPASISAMRSRSVPLALFDEIAFWPGEGYADPDKTLVDSVKPGQSEVPDPLLLGLSSPYGRRGVLWDRYVSHYGEDNPRVLVWKAPTLYMNGPVEIRDEAWAWNDRLIRSKHDRGEVGEYIAWLDTKIAKATDTARWNIVAEVKSAYEDDPVSASSEYGAEFRADAVALIAIEDLQPCIDVGVTVRAPQDGVAYVGFVDPSGGRKDSFGLSIAHWDGRVLQDYVREWVPPFDFDQVVNEAGAILTRYGLTQVHGDAWGNDATEAHFRRVGVLYHVSDRTRSELYRDLLPLVTSGKVRLLDNERQKTQLLGLERSPGQGREKIDHRPNQHDDVANACAGACTLADKFRRPARAFKHPVVDPQEQLREKLRKWAKPTKNRAVWGGSRKA